MSKEIVTIVHPKDLDLAVPPLGPGGSGMTLRQIAKGYSAWVTPKWKRACNIEYRSGPSGPPVSLIVEGGKIWSPGDMRWPVFAVKDGKAEIAKTANYDQVTSARFAFSAGPWLVRDGKVCNIANEIKSAGFSGLMEGSQRERAAIGIRSDGMVVHYATMAATLVQIAEKMKALGCADAINLDGGGSVGVLNGDKLFGYSVRHVACALMFREIMEGEPVAPEPQPVIPVQPASPGGDSKMYICIDPGHGGKDPGAVANGIQEKDVNLAVALLARDLLRTQGVEVLITRQDDSFISLQDRTDLANREKVDAFVSIHHNAADNTGARGLEVYHSIVGGEGKRLAELIHDQYQALIPELPSRGVRTRKNSDGRDYYHVIRATRMPAVIVEGGFLTNSQDAALIKSRAFQEKQARAINQAVLLWYGREIDEGEGTPIMGPPRATVTQAQAWAQGRGSHQRFIAIAPVYWEVGQTIGIRPEVAYCQAAKETAFGRYGGAVRPEQNNWAGIKIDKPTGDKTSDHQSFATPDDGVRGHFNHIAAYVGLEPIGTPHPRYYVVKGMPWAGTVRTVEELGAKWAPNPNYGISIRDDYLLPMLTTEEPPPQEDIKAVISELEKRVLKVETILARISQVLEEECEKT